MAENAGMLLWIWLLATALVGLFIASSTSGTSAMGAASDRPLAERQREGRSRTDESTMVEGVPDSELISKREIRPS